MDKKQSTKKTLFSLALAASVLATVFSGCDRKEKSAPAPTPEKKVMVQEKTPVQEEAKPQRISLPSGAGILCQDKQVILIPNIYENRDQYEKRLKEINQYSKEAGYTFITIIDSQNKMIYDAAMMEIYPRVHKQMYNMLNNPVSSWASMQIGGGKFVARYTPADILKAMMQTRERGTALQ